MNKALYVLIILLCVACQAGDATGMNSRGIMLLSLMNKEAKGENAAISYYSIAQVLSMTELGAKGDTSAELREGLALPRREFFLKTNKIYSKYRKADILMANKIWLDVSENVLSDYQKGVKKHYASEVAVADFSREPVKCKEEINAFVSKCTKKQIPKFLNDSFDVSMARMFLVNAIYFKSDWLDSFDAAKTHDAVFRNANGEEKKASFMHKDAQMKILDSPKLECKAVALPYKQEGIYYIAFLPNDTDGIDALLTKLAETDIGGLIDKEFTVTKVSLDIPKLSIDVNVSILNSLKELGISKPFMPSADFTGMSRAGLFIAEVLHAVKLDMDEKGTVASAATGVLATRGLGARLCFDRPFVGLLYDRKSDVVLFSMTVNTVAKK